MCCLLIQAVTLFLTFATICLSTPAPSLAKDITTVAGTTGSDHVSIRFQAPCPGCGEDSDRGLDLTLEIDSADEECTTSTPRLNGLPLVASNYGNGVSSGQVFLKSDPAGERDVQASWESTCLKGEASIVSVRLEGVVGQDPFETSSGFTTSFKQKGRPTVLRLQDKPVAQLSQSLCDDWLLPDDEAISIFPVLSDILSPDDISLQVEYAKLAQLQSEMQDLHDELHVVLRNIMTLLKNEFKSCSSMKCIWDTAVNEVSPIAKLVVSHFNHHKNLIDGCREGDAQSPCSANVDEDTLEDDELNPTEIAHDELDSPYIVEDVQISATTPAPTMRPSSSSQSTTQTSPLSASNTARTVSPTASSTTVAVGPLGLPHGRTQEDQLALQRKLGLAIIFVILLVIIAGLAIRAIVKFRDPRRRAERAARREERRTKRLYAKAACKHKWRTWWKGLTFRQQASDDYEEKRETILEQEGLLLDEDGSGVQKEIRTMQYASEFVRDLVHAEEGRARNVRQPRDSDGFEPAELEGGVRSSRLSDIAPSYKSDVTPPPRYEQDLEGEMVIVSGFGYTPSNTDDNTSASSVVDCSPRLSLETGRSTILTKDTRD